MFPHVNMENSEGVAIYHQESLICFWPQADLIVFVPYPPHLYHTEEELPLGAGEVLESKNKTFW